MHHMWMIRADGGRLVQPFLHHRMAAVNFGPSREFGRPVDHDELYRWAERWYPTMSPAGWTNGAKQMRFLLDAMRDGHSVITYDPRERRYHLGRVTGDYRYRPDTPLPNHPATGFAYVHARDVDWRRAVSRDDLSAPAKRHLHQLKTIFLIDPVVAEELLDKAK